MSDVTEYDLLQALRDKLPKPVGAGEFTIKDWQRRWNVRRAVAEGELIRLVELGEIERLPEKRLQHGHLSIAYRVVIKSDK
jgi:hypothetical protein